VGDQRNSEHPPAPAEDEEPDASELEPDPEAHEEPEPTPDEHFHDDEPDEHEDDVPRRSVETRRRRLEKLVPDLLKRAIERGIEAGLNSLGNASKSRERSEGTIPPPAPSPSSAGSNSAPHPASAARESVREAQRELASVPKEIAGYVFSQIDDTKNATVRVVAREVREFLEAADLATELQKALTKLSFEIRTEIRFIPNDSGGIKPEVKAAVTPRRDKRPPGRRPTALASEEQDPDE
jgi:hypothetical protein